MSFKRCNARTLTLCPPNCQQELQQGRVHFPIHPKQKNPEESIKLELEISKTVHNMKTDAY